MGLIKVILQFRLETLQMQGSGWVASFGIKLPGLEFLGRQGGPK